MFSSSGILVHIAYHQKTPLFKLVVVVLVLVGRLGVRMLTRRQHKGAPDVPTLTFKLKI